MDSFKDVLAKIQEKELGKYAKHEWQIYAYNLARWLGDLERVSFYMQLAKTEDRNLIQGAWDFVKESNPKSKPKLFLWKLSQLRKERAEKEKEPKKPS